MLPRSPVTLPLVQPIVPVLRGAPFDDPAWLFEPKYDGFRGPALRRTSVRALPLEAGQHDDPVPAAGRAGAG
jgi:hypothetical protein